jgi:hypothetical protein
MKHALGMLIGCGLAFLVAFLLPALGVSGNAALVIFFILMVGCHLFMGWGAHGKEEHEQHGDKA